MNESQRRFVHSAYPIEIALLAVALLVFLIVIGNVLVTINDNLGVTDQQATQVNRSATSLPGLIDSITNSLTSIQNDVKPIPGQLDQINAGLANASKGLGTAETNLSQTDASLKHVESPGLIASLAYADRVRDGSIAIVNQLGNAGAQLTTAVNLLNAVHADAANISGQATTINGHLTSINNVQGLGPIIQSVTGILPPGL